MLFPEVFFVIEFLILFKSLCMFICFNASYFLQNLPEGAAVGVDTWCISIDTAKKWEQAFAKKQQKLVPTSTNLVDEVWKNRPPMKINPVLVHPLQFAGLSVADKLNVLREKLEKEKARGIIFTTLDEVVSQPYKLLTLVSCLTCKLLLDILFDHLVEHFCEGCVVVQYSWE